LRVIRIKDRPSLERITCRCYRLMCAHAHNWHMTKAKRNVIFALSAFCAAAEFLLLAG
jgi:hypothetical protein